MSKAKPKFESNTVFHVYNHGNAEDNIFHEEENYRYFLKQYAHYIYPVAKTYAFCLMPNHFHLMLEVRSAEELVTYFKEEKPDKDLSGFENLTSLVSKQFSNLLNSYAKAFNNRYGRRGKLFLNSLERKPIKNKVYYSRLITYIHQNPVHHGFVQHPRDWPYSSYHIFLSNKKTKIERAEVLDWFGGQNGLVEFHQQNQEIDAEAFY